MALAIDFEWFLFMWALLVIIGFIGLKYPVLAMVSGVLQVAFWIFFIADGDSLTRTFPCQLAAGSCVGAASFTQTVFSWVNVSGINESVFYGGLMFFPAFLFMLLGVGLVALKR